MRDEIGLFEAMYTQRAIRYLKSCPVPDESVRKVIEAATKAPSGGNSQPWKFMVIRDPANKAQIAEYYLRSWEAAYGSQAANQGTLQSHVRLSADHMARNMANAPVLIVACLQHSGTPRSMAAGSSIYPAVQNLLLAARGIGLGSVITTLHKRYEEEIKTLLGIPENVETAAILPVGYPEDGVTYGPTRRASVDDVTYWERWG